MGRRNFFYRFVDRALQSGLRAVPTSSLSERVALWWGYRYVPGPAVVTLRSGTVMHVDPTDYLQLLLYYQGTFEPHCLAFLPLLLRSNDIFVDVGANIGLYTLEASRIVGSSGRVIAVEAALPHVETLRRNLAANRVDNVTIVSTAAGASSGDAVLSLGDGENLGMYTIGRVSGGVRQRVQVARLDDILGAASVTQVALLKMDIEGAELAALRGARRLISELKPTLIIELNDQALARCEATSGEVKNLLREAGYLGWIVGRRSIRAMRETQSHLCDECLFVHRERWNVINRLGLPH
jgi:FkbM family methyltransferase